MSNLILPQFINIPVDLAESARDRFFSHIEKRETCWLWTGPRIPKGYGRFSLSRKGKVLQVYAHRVAYVLAGRKLRADFDIDHLCRNTRCVNPDHLEAVPRRTNLLRGNTIVATEHEKTECKRGHPLSGTNLKIERGTRQCRECRRYRQTKRYRDEQLNTPKV